MKHQAKLLCQVLADQVGYTTGRQDDMNRLVMVVLDENWDDLTQGLPEQLSLNDQLRVLTTLVYRLSETIRNHYGGQS